MAGSDWRSRLRPASYRGARFWVETESFEGGRRLVVHEFPLSETPYIEDMGQQARRFELSAYCVGGQADKEAVRLVEACCARGGATLVLPMLGTQRARCMNIRLDRRKDKQGYVAYRLRFFAEGNALSSLGGAPHLQSRVRSAVAEMPVVLERALGASFASVGRRSRV